MAAVMCIYFWLLVCRLASVTCSDLLSRQKRLWIISTFTIEEEHPGPFPFKIGQIQIEEAYRVYFDLLGAGVDKEPKGLLSMDKETGTILVHKPVNYEEYQNLRLTFESWKTDLLVETKMVVEIEILDINDNPPFFQRDMYSITIGESERQGSYLLSVLAHDKDKRGSPNSTFDYKMESVSPQPAHAEFSINKHGTITFKGCLDSEGGQKYTMVVKAQDHGEVVSLSSSTTVIIHVKDENNHLPTITGHTGSSKVQEGQTGTSPLRLHVTDKDTKGTAAWRAKYTIEGNEGGHFKIETDPETNDGILSVVKALDFEDGAEIQLSISVENEESYFSCEVKKRTASGLWTVDTTEGVPRLSSEIFTIHVEDVNEPPVFTMSIKDSTIEENAEVGSLVEMMTAMDLDSRHASKLVYVKGDDPADWVTVHPQTGQISTAKRLDRESTFMDNDVYTVTIYAVDNGNPPSTGTGTLRIHVIDQNDNVPQLTVNHVDICLSDGPTRANIKAFDLDRDPNGGPFLFQLLGDADRKWSLDPSFGFSVNLVKEPSVHAGIHSLEMKISDMQGLFAIQNLSVTVCDCSVNLNCQRDRVIVTRVGYGAIGIIFTSLFTLLCFLLFSVAMSSGKERFIIQVDSTGDTLVHLHTETLGTDCQLPTVPLVLPTNNQQTIRSHWYPSSGGTRQTQSTEMVLDQYISLPGDYVKEHLYSRYSDHSVYKMMALHSVQDGYSHQKSLLQRKKSTNEWSSGFETDVFILSLLHQRLCSIQAPGEELEDYDPHSYADEGDSEEQYELDAISIHDTLDFRKLQELDSKFDQLAALCFPDAAKP